MEELIQNVEIINQINYTDFIKYNLRLPNGNKIVLDQCRATYNFALIPMPIIILAGTYEVEAKDKTLHQKTGILRIYPNRIDLLIK